MDTVSAYYEQQKDLAKRMGFAHVLPINTDTFPVSEFERMWDKIREADYAFEDTTKGNKDLFLQNMLRPGTFNFEVPGKIFGQIVGAWSGSNAQIHFIILDTSQTAFIMDAASEVFRFAFKEVGVHRITAYIPTFNQQVIRLASLSRMKFEGILRQAFLYQKQWWDVQIYGLLDTEWQRRT